MGALGKIISDAVGAAKDAVLEKEPKLCTTVEDFLTKFSDSSGKYANQINTLTTFEVSFKFYPTLDQVVKNDKDDKEKKSKLGKALDAAVGSVKSSFTKAAKNAVNNLTGGLLASLNNEKKNDVAAVMDQHGSFKDKGTYSFMHYLAAANLLVGDENEWFGKAGQSPKPLEMQLGYYV